MHCQAWLTALALLMGVSHSAAGSSSLTIPLSRRQLGITREDGSVDMSALIQEEARTGWKYAKNAKHLARRGQPEASSSRFVRERRGGIQLKLASASVWTGTISVGNPPQNFSMYFDSGSTDLTLPDIACTELKCGTKARYSPSNSTTALNLNKTVTSRFADGSSSIGQAYADVVVGGGISVQNQTVISATSLSSTVAGLPSDGIMGLAFSGLSATGTDSFPVSMYKSGQGNYVGLRLAASNTSAITMGNLNISAIPGRVSWYNISSANTPNPLTYWQVNGSMTTVNGQPALSQRAEYVIDSGTTLIVAAPKYAAEFWRSVEGSAPYDSNHWTFPCANPPTVAFQFGSSTKRQFSVAAADFSLGFVPSNRTRCVGAVVGIDVGLGSDWILGDSFMKVRQQSGRQTKTTAKQNDLLYNPTWAPFFRVGTPSSTLRCDG
ncbi:acid protease [Meredithblackwellia eburnea MCA 4105]